MFYVKHIRLKPGTMGDRDRLFQSLYDSFKTK